MCCENSPLDFCRFTQEYTKLKFACFMKILESSLYLSFKNSLITCCFVKNG